jgi:hypothetical protein
VTGAGVAVIGVSFCSASITEASVETEPEGAAVTGEGGVGTTGIENDEAVVTTGGDACAEEEDGRNCCGGDMEMRKTVRVREENRKEGRRDVVAGILEDGGVCGGDMAMR